MATAVGEQAIDVSLHGTMPFVIHSDPTLLTAALSNGVRNAGDAVVGAHSDERHLIVVNWGETDVDYWVAVMDRGSGLVGPVGLAFEIGKTTKEGHNGFGLPIAKQAVETLGGSCTLQALPEGGAHFEIRWER